MGISSSIPQPLIIRSLVNSALRLQQSAHHRLDIPHLSNQLLPAAATCVSPTHPRSSSRPKGVTLHPSPSSLLLWLWLCLSHAVLTWRACCTARYNPDVTTNPSSTHSTATPKTSSGQTHTHIHRGKKQRCSVRLLTVQIQVVNAVMLSEPFYQPLVQQHQTIKEKRNCQASPTGASYTNPVSWLNTAKITSKSFSLQNTQQTTFIFIYHILTTLQFPARFLGNDRKEHFELNKQMQRGIS